MGIIIPKLKQLYKKRQYLLKLKDKAERSLKITLDNFTFNKNKELERHFYKTWETLHFEFEKVRDDLRELNRIIYKVEKGEIK